MDIILMFLAKHYISFIIITIILILALVGYFVDEKDRKVGISLVDRPKEEEQDIHALAMSASNKSLNSALSDNVKKSNNKKALEEIEQMEQARKNNTIVDISENKNEEKRG